MVSATKAKSQQFTRRKHSLFKRANQLSRLCKADLALIIRKNHKYYMYRSIDHQNWPPPLSQIETSYPLPTILAPEDFDSPIKSPDKEEDIPRDSARGPEEVICK